MDRVLIIVMGVAGSGKSTIGQSLAINLGCDFIDGDDLHPPANVQKMATGCPLNDQDRVPWLKRIRQVAIEKTQNNFSTHFIVIACSALKKSYRDLLRSSNDTFPSLQTIIVYLRGTNDLLFQRLSNRQGHFMKSSMLESQLNDLQEPDASIEPNIIIIDIDHDKDQIATKTFVKVKELIGLH